MGINGGRSLRGIEERLKKFMANEERNRSWVIQKALDEFLKKKGY